MTQSLIKDKKGGLRHQTLIIVIKYLSLTEILIQGLYKHFKVINSAETIFIRNSDKYNHVSNVIGKAELCPVLRLMFQ